MFGVVDWGFVLFVLIFPAVLWFFGGYRNHLVYSYRNSVINSPNGLDEYDKLPPYFSMVFNPIKWPARKLKKLYTPQTGGQK